MKSGLEARGSQDVGGSLSPSLLRCPAVRRDAQRPEEPLEKKTSTAAMSTAARRCSGRSTRATSPRSGVCCGRRRRVARQQLRRHADEPRRRSRQHRHPEAAPRSRRECRLPQCRRTDGTHGGGENGQRRRRAGAAGPPRHRRCAGKMGRTDRADVGVRAPASGDDAAADRQGRRRQRALHRSRLSASCDGRGASQEPGQRWVHAAALRRA